MPLPMNHEHVRALAKNLRDLTGREIKHTAIIEAIAASVGRKGDALMHELKTETAITSKGLPAFEFPRDPRSSYNHIATDAIRLSLARLTVGLEEHFKDDRDLKAMLSNMGGWHIVNALKIGALCAFMKGLDPRTDYDAALVAEGLTNHGIVPSSTTAPSSAPAMRDEDADAVARRAGYRKSEYEEGGSRYVRPLKGIPTGEATRLEVSIFSRKGNGSTVDRATDQRVWTAQVVMVGRNSETVLGNVDDLTLHEAVNVGGEMIAARDSYWSRGSKAPAVFDYVDWRPSETEVTEPGKVELSSGTADDARILAKANGFQVWDIGGGCKAFAKLLKRADTPSGDEATLDVMITVEGGTSINAAPEDMVWGAGVNYQDPLGGDTVVSTETDNLTLMDAINAAKRFAGLADDLWAKHHDAVAIEEYESKTGRSL